MSDLDDELPTDLSRALEDERNAPGLSDARRDAMWTKLEANLTAPPGAGNGPPGGSTGGALWRALRILGPMAVGVVAGGALHATYMQTSVPTPPHAATVATQATTTHADSPSRPSSVASESASVVREIPHAEDAATAKGAPVSSTASAPASSNPTSVASATSDMAPSAAVAPTSGGERGLIERGRAALARRDWLSALEAIHERDKAFPTGELREERDALEVQALALAGRSDEARTKAVSFLKRYPDSVFALKIDAVRRELTPNQP